MNDRVPPPPTLATPDQRAMWALPRRTAVWYGVVASVWIVGSDLVVAAQTDSEPLVNSAKGLAFVAVTSVGLFAVLTRWVGRAIEGWSAAERERQRFEALVEHSGDIILVFGPDRLISYASPGLERVLGWDPREAIGRRGRTLVHPDDRDAAVAYLDDVGAGEVSRAPRILRLLTPDGRWKHVELLAVDQRGVPAVGGMVVHGRDVTERQLVQSRLDEALTHDLVTGIATAQRFAAELRDAALAAAAGNQSLLLLNVDLVAFRETNRAIGRAGGDQALRAVAKRLRESLEPETLGRVGADEFGVALLLPGDETAERRSEAAARELVAAITAPLSIGDTPLRLTASVGGALLRSASEIDDVQAVADSNLRVAKSHPDRIVVTTVASSAPAVSSGATMASALYDAIECDELRVHYQPQCSLASGQVVGAEALVRWQHPTRGLIRPNAFLAEFMRNNLLPQMTRFVLGEAAAQSARWAAQGHAVTVSVNLSLDDLRRVSLATEVLDAIATAGADPASIVLELTEQTLLAEPERSLTTIRALRDEGIRFSIDDFGTGYSSLTHLRTLPVEELKIDQSFIATMTSSEIDDSIVSAVIGLGHQIGLTVVAEGVEDHETLDRLSERGCDRVQGYLISRPVPPGELSFEPLSRR